MSSGNVVCHVFYALLLLFTTALAIVAIATPDWIHRDDVNDIGVPKLTRFEAGPITYCTTNVTDAESCQRWGDQPDDIPGNYWKGTAGAFIAALIIMILSVLFTFITFCCCKGAQKPQAGLVILSALLIVVAMFLFGAGLQTTETAKGEASIHHGISCGTNAGQFEGDECQIGVGGGLAIASAVLTFICGVMACFIVPHVDTKA